MSYEQDKYGRAQSSATLKYAGVGCYATSLRSPSQIIRDAIDRAQVSGDYIAMADLAVKLHSVGG